MPLSILYYPDPKLRIKAAPIRNINANIQALSHAMLMTMYSAKGIGLAAPQVGRTERLIVVDVSETGNDPHIFINPQILQCEGCLKTKEGCLSLPTIYETVQRSKTILVEALTLKGKRTQFEAEGLFAVCIQHEIDHLNGVLFIDYLSKLKQLRIQNRMANPRG